MQESKGESHSDNFTHAKIRIGRDGQVDPRAVSVEFAVDEVKDDQQERYRREQLLKLLWLPRPEDEHEGCPDYGDAKENGATNVENWEQVREQVAARCKLVG